jgi:hypothetical protein
MFAATWVAVGPRVIRLALATEADTAGAAGDAVFDVRDELARHRTPATAEIALDTGVRVIDVNRTAPEPAPVTLAALIDVPADVAESLCVRPRGLARREPVTLYPLDSIKFRHDCLPMIGYRPA